MATRTTPRPPGCSPTRSRRSAPRCAAVLRARGNASYHRNNELLAALDHAFNTNVEVNDPYFRRFVFELDTDASLNWYLSSEEKKRIAGRFRDDADVQNQAKALAEWLGDGGGKQR